MNGRKKAALSVGVLVLMLVTAIACTRLRLKWHAGAIHVATFKRFENGTETNYFLEIPLWFK
jgi:hypothetical protein